MKESSASTKKEEVHAKKVTCVLVLPLFHERNGKGARPKDRRGKKWTLYFFLKFVFRVYKTINGHIFSTGNKMLSSFFGNSKQMASRANKFPKTHEVTAAWQLLK